MNDLNYQDKGLLISNSKPLTRSITFWGGVTASFPLIWNTVLTNLPHITEGIDVVVASGALPPETAAIISAVGGILAIVGRVKAKKTIKGIKK